MELPTATPLDIAPRIRTRVLELRRKNREKGKGVDQVISITAQLHLLEAIADDLSFAFYSADQTDNRQAFMRACGFEDDAALSSDCVGVKYRSANAAYDVIGLNLGFEVYRCENGHWHVRNKRERRANA
jgi:hypothetical protein